MLAQSEVLGRSVDLITQLNQTEFSRNIRDEDENDSNQEEATLRGQSENYQEEAKKVRREVELRNQGKANNLTGPVGVTYESLLDKM